MPDMSIFDGDNFSLQTLTAAINEQDVTPTRIAELGLFAEESITTTSVTVERREQAAELVMSAARGSTGGASAGATRSILTFNAAHLPVTETVLADSIQNVRAFGSTDELETVQGVINRRLAVARARLDATIEYHRLGAIKGQVLDADGATVLNDIYTAFGITRPTEVIQAGNANVNLRQDVVKAKRTMEDGLKGQNYEKTIAFAGEAFMNAITDHKSTKEAYNRWQDGAMLRNDYRNNFGLAGVVFEEYRMNVGGTPFVAADEAYMLPVGAFEMFKTCFAPADFEDTVNTPGLPYYAKQWQTDNSGKSRTLQAQSNPICLNLRPAAVVKLTLA